MKDSSANQFGSVEGPGVHDAIVQTIHFIDNDRLDVRLKTQQGHEKWIHLVDVARIGFKDVTNGLIVSDVFWWRLDQAAPGQSGTLDAWRVLLGGNCLEKDLQATVSKLAIEHDSSFLVLFESSYGGQIAAICRQVTTDTLQNMDNQPRV
jgi:hypothetical protein